MPSYRLTYFNLKGRAQLSRLLFAAAGVEFEDNRIQWADWPGLKPSMPFGQVPVLEIDGKQFAQSFAIASYLANEFGLYGKNNMERLEIDQTLELLKDFIFYLNKSFNEPDKDKKVEYMKEAVEIHCLTYLKHFENLLKGSTTGFLVGSELSIGDLAVFDHLDYISERNTTALDDCPHLRAFRDKIGNIESIKRFMDQENKS